MWTGHCSQWTPLTILGESKSRIQLAGGEFVHNILVTEDIRQDCLLGADFLVLHGVVLDLKSRTLSQGDSSTPLSLPQPESPSVCRVTIGDNLILRGEEERLLWADINSSSSFPTDAAGVIEPKEGFEERHQLLMARVVAVPVGGAVPVRIANLTTSTVTLQRHHYRKILSPCCAEQSCCSFCRVL